MAAILVNDQLTTLSMEEVNGVIRSLTRIARITGLVSFDYQVLLAAYVEVGLPRPGSFLQNPPLSPVGPQGPLAMLVLAKRSFKVVEEKHTVDVTLQYEHFMEGDNQVLSPGAETTAGGNKMPNTFIVFGKNRASVQQLKSNFYLNQFCLPNGQPVPAWIAGSSYLIGAVVDYNGFFWVSRVLIEEPVIPAPDLRWAPPPGPGAVEIGVYWDLAVEGVDIFPILDPPVRRQVAVGHRFPTTDQDVPGQVKYQTGEFTILQPNENFKLHGQVFVRNPRTIKKALTGAINSIPWMDAGAYEWMCTEVSWEPLFPQTVAGLPQPGQWRMTFEFQHNEDTWLPTAIFNDQRTGRPPADLVPGFGFRELHRQPEIDFEAFFMLSFGCIPEAGA